MWLYGLFIQIPATSTDICENDPDPFSSFEFHATAVTGEIVGACSNGQCGTGIAYNALVGCELVITTCKCTQAVQPSNEV